MTAPNYVGTNPVTVGDSRRASHYAALAGNNERLRDHLAVQHKFEGAGQVGGKHWGIARYSGAGSVASDNAAHDILAATTDADFAVGLWECVVIAGNATVGYLAGVWHFGFPNAAASLPIDEYADIYNSCGTSSDLTGFAYNSNNAIDPLAAKYLTSAPTKDHGWIRFVFASGTPSVQLAIGNNTGTAITYSYAIARVNR